jgi:hypothetical protein
MRAVRALAGWRRNGLIDLDPPDPADENAVRIYFQQQTHRGICGIEHRTSGVAAQLRDRGMVADPHTQVGLQRAEAEVEQGRYASRSRSSSVNTVRRFIAQPPAGRQRATRWLQLDLATHSNANGRHSSDSSMAMPPRAVTAAAPVSDRVRLTFSSRSRENSAMPPKVPRLHCVSASAICACSNSIAALCVAIDRYSPGVQPEEYRFAWP